MTPKILDLSVLPEDARKEVADFYEFMKSKHLLKKRSGNPDLSGLIPRKVPAFTPLSRDEAHER